MQQAPNLAVAAAAASTAAAAAPIPPQLPLCKMLGVNPSQRALPLQPTGHGWERTLRGGVPPALTTWLLFNGPSPLNCPLQPSRTWLSAPPSRRCAARLTWPSSGPSCAPAVSVVLSLAWLQRTSSSACRGRALARAGSERVAMHLHFWHHCVFKGHFTLPTRRIGLGCSVLARCGGSCHPALTLSFRRADCAPSPCGAPSADLSLACHQRPTRCHSSAPQILQN